LPYTYAVEHKHALRFVASVHRRLIESSARIERQRAIIARLDDLGVDSTKQTQLLSALIEVHDQQAQLVAEALDSNPLPPRASRQALPGS
jgi:hypothetical protein